MSRRQLLLWGLPLAAVAGAATTALAGEAWSAVMLRFDAMRLAWAKRCEDVDRSYRGFELAWQILGDPLPDCYGKEE